MFAALVVASFAAFFATQRLKHTPTAVQLFKMTPVFYPTRTPAAACRAPVPRGKVLGSRALEYLSFRIAHADAVTVTIIDSAGDDVATIVHDHPLRRYKQLSLCWNGHRGRRERGAVAPAGEYRVRVSLREQHRPVLSQRSFTLVRGSLR